MSQGSKCHNSVDPGWGAITIMTIGIAFFFVLLVGTVFNTYEYIWKKKLYAVWSMAF